MGCTAHWRHLANTTEPSVTVRVLRRCGLMSNYFDHLIVFAILHLAGGARAKSHVALHFSKTMWHVL